MYSVLLTSRVEKYIVFIHMADMIYYFLECTCPSRTYIHIRLARVKGRRALSAIRQSCLQCEVDMNHNNL